MLRLKEVKSILNKHKKRDSWFLDEYSINPYEGCSCNCQYCYIRGSKYGENMNEGLTAKSNLVDVLEKQLQFRVRKEQYGIIAVGTGTDAYMPHEEQLQLTRSALELILKYRFPVFISTKRSLITRDIDLLKKIDISAILPADISNKLNRGVILSVSVSSMDDTISSTLEPGALRPLERLQLITKLKEEGFLVGVNAMPVLPFISDSEEELEKMIKAAKEHGADYILVGGLTLFGNEPADSRTLYYKFLERQRPDLIPGYNKLYGNNFYPPFQYNKQLKERADKLCRLHQIRNTITGQHE